MKRVATYGLCLFFFVLLSPWRCRSRVCLVIHIDESWSGNLKVLYNELLRKGYKVSVLNLSKRLDTAHALRTANVVSSKNILSLPFLLSGNVITTHGPDPITAPILKINARFAKRINVRKRRHLLWHGVGSKIHDAEKNFWMKYADFAFEFIHANDFFDKQRMSSFLNVDLDKITVTGYPRLSYLTLDENKLSINIKKELDEASKVLGDKKLILYAPSWEVVAHRPIDFLKKISSLENIINKHKDFVFGVRLHPKNHKLLESLEFSENVMQFSSDRFATTEILLRKAFCLITDISSIWYDFSLLERPIFFDCQEQRVQINNGRISKELYSTAESKNPGRIYKLSDLESYLSNTSQKVNILKSVQHQPNAVEKIVKYF